MIVSETLFNQNSDFNLLDELDCVWLVFSSGRGRGPCADDFVQYLDWKLNGRIARYLGEVDSATPIPTVIPIPSLKNNSNFKRGFFLVLQPEESFDSCDFFKKCDGLNVSKVMLYLETGVRKSKIQAALQGGKSGRFPLELTFGGPLEMSR